MAKYRPLLTELRTQFPGRSKKELHAHILCGEVAVDSEIVRDPKRPVPSGARIEIRGDTYVSRGGHKLEEALRVFRFQVGGRAFLDAGASTGGFTDCLLRHGAATVHAVESGHNQLAYRLRVDSRVVVREDTPIQSVVSLDPAPDAAVADISFRSLRGVARHILSLTVTGEGILLLKPQFEWIGPPERFDGVVRSDEDLLAILTVTISDLLGDGVLIREAVESPIRGHEGNREFLIHVGMAIPGGKTPKAEDVAEALVRAGAYPKELRSSGAPM